MYVTYRHIVKQWKCSLNGFKLKYIFEGNKCYFDMIYNSYAIFDSGTTIFSNGSACVSMKKIQNKKNEMVLRSCDYKLPSICQRRDANSKTSFIKLI